MSPQIYEAGKGHESRPCRMEAARGARERLYGGCKLLRGGGGVSGKQEKCRTLEYQCRGEFCLLINK